MQLNSYYSIMLQTEYGAKEMDKAITYEEALELEDYYQEQHPYNSVWIDDSSKNTNKEGIL